MLYLNWSHEVGKVVTECGFSGAWDSQCVVSRMSFMEHFRVECDMQHVLEQYSLSLGSHKGDLYSLLVPDMDYKVGAWYLNVLNSAHRKAITRLRCRNVYHRLETGAWQGIPRDTRLCRVCNVLDDDVHYVLTCRRYAAQRKKYIPARYTTSPDTDSLVSILTSRDIALLHRLALFLINTTELQKSQYEVDKNIDSFARIFISLG